jgi:SAM-dependent methyltransferase
VTEVPTTVERNDRWERYWHELPPAAGSAVWDSEASGNASRHHCLFRPYFTAGLPLLDLGCGNGTQTAYLSQHYSPIIGLDVSASAVLSAARAHGGPGISFRQFDVVDPAAASAVHAELGDCNVYVRTLLHLLPDDARTAAAATIARLLGRSGALFITELAHAAIEVFEDALGAGDDSVPKIRRVLSYGIVGANLADGQLEALLRGAGIAIVASGSDVMGSTDTIAGGARLMIPTSYVIGRPG